MNPFLQKQLLLNPRFPGFAFNKGVAAGGGFTTTSVVKDGDTTRTNTNTFSDDPDLQFNTEANSVYDIRWIAFVDGNSTTDFKYQWSIPTGARFVFSKNNETQTFTES